MKEFQIKNQRLKGELQMTKEKMTIHRALSEVKMLNQRITKMIANDTYINSVRHSSDKISGVPIEDVKNTIKGNYDQVTALIERRNAIWRAITQSNAITKVTISGVEYTVAEAIETKNHNLEFYSMLYAELSNQYTKTLSHVNRDNEIVATSGVERFLTSIYGNKDKADAEDIETAKKKYIESNSFDLIDPIDIKSKIDQLSEKIDSFTSEVDSVLSESNAMTTIEVEY